MTRETPDQRELRFEELLRESARAAADYDASEEEIDHGAAHQADRPHSEGRWNLSGTAGFHGLDDRPLPINKSQAHSAR